MEIFRLINFGYIDPGVGLPFFTMGSIILGVIIGFLGGLLFWARRILRFFLKGKKLLWLLILTAVIAGVVFYINITKEVAGCKEKIVIIGLDGLEPEIMERLMGEGKLPNFKKLKEQGTYARLATSYPAESLVAWTNFATGSNAGKHGAYGFLKRDPNTYMPYLAFSRVDKDTKKLKRVAGGTPFWNITRKYKIPTVLLCCPNAFPPDKVYGRLLSGMGVPDIRGTMGTSSFYTTADIEKGKDIGGRLIKVTKRGANINTYLSGPVDTSLRKANDIIIPMKVAIDEQAQTATVDVGGNQFMLRPKQWSQWQAFTFKINFFKRVKGICKFYLKSITPEFELYISPINFDPRDPPFAISYPAGYSKELADRLGLYHTLGMPHDTWALNENKLDEVAFLEQADMIIEEKQQMLDIELERFKKGVFFYYLDSPSFIQHAFWRFIDPQHPAYDEELAVVYSGVIDKMYERMDNILGRVFAKTDEDTLLIVLSDHGFKTFRRSVHLNTWLRENGFLFLEDPAAVKGGEFFKDVDWSRTTAYSVGFGEIFVNQIGREAKGCVRPGAETQKIKKEIADRLTSLYDEKFASNVINKVYNRDEIFWGPYINEAPDLLVGYNIGYRSSWQTALGSVPEEIIEDNKKAWSGDHLSDPSLLPGVLFTNRKIEAANPAIVDVVPTILKILGIPEDEFKDMDGRPFM